jgi:SNF2 family DNA or RNA helicase
MEIETEGDPDVLIESEKLAKFDVLLTSYEDCKEDHDHLKLIRWEVRP